MKALLLSVSISTLASALAVSASAQTFPASDQAGTDASLPAEVVITATRVPTDKLDVANSITVFTAADIAAKQAPSLPDVLKDSPGLNVVQTGGAGGQTSVFMRGTNSNHVKVLVDGIDVSDPSSPNAAFDFGGFLSPDIARVEVLRGPQSGLYGSDAIGGVINVITKSGEGPPHGALTLEGGSFDTFNQSGDLAGSTGGFHYSANVEHFHAGATPVTPLDLLAPGEKRIDDYYDNLTLSTKLGYDVTNALSLGLVARYTDTHLRTTGENYAFTPPYIDYPDASQSRSDTRQYYTRATAHLGLLDGKADTTFGLAYSHIDSKDTSPDNGDSEYAGDRFKADWQGVAKLAPGETAIVGVEHQRDAISQPVSAHTSIDSIYGELQSNPLTNFNNSLSLRYDSNSRFGDKVTYRIAPTYFVASTGTKLEASLGTGFKAPSLSEMFQSFPGFGFFANPNLKPESSTGYDLGFEQFLSGDRIQFGATYFHNRIKNLIDDNATFTSYANVGRAHTQGVESFVLWKPIDILSVRFDYTYTEAKDDILHQALLRRPRNKFNFDTRWQATKALSFDADLVAIGSFIDGNRDFSIPRLKASGYTTVDLAANFDVNSAISLYGRITNAFDEHYENPVGYLRPGRGVYVGVKGRY